MTPTMKPVNHLQAKGRQFRAAFSAWAVVGVLPDGREEVLDIGTREGVQQSYTLLFNCPTYDSVFPTRPEPTAPQNGG